MRVPEAAGLLLLLMATSPARAAQSYENCVGFVDSLPAVITTQGTWCLRKDVSMALTTGTAIEIAANNVTLDCNHFKIGGLAAGLGTMAMGVEANGPLNATVRNCTIRGFYRGLWFHGAGAGHLVQGNRFEANTYVGIRLAANQSAIRDNLVLDTGGSALVSNFAYGIYASGDGVQILDNAVNGVAVASQEGSTTTGIYFSGTGDYGAAEIGRNWVQGLTEQSQAGIYSVYAIQAASGRPVVRDNTLHAPFAGPDGEVGSVGVQCDFGTGLARTNLLYGFDSSVINCSSSGNVVVAP